MNGIAVTDYDGTPTILNFAYVVRMTKDKTEGTARFRSEDLGGDGVRIWLAGNQGHVIWITDPPMMEAVWHAFHAWCDQVDSPQH